MYVEGRGSAELATGRGFCCCSLRYYLHFSICARHPCAGAVLIFSASFQFQGLLFPEGNPNR